MNIHDHPMPTLMLRGDGCVRDVNGAACSLMGMGEGQLKGAVLERVFLSVEGGPSPERFLGDLLTRGNGRFDGVLLGASGARHRVTAWGWRPNPPLPQFWVHLMPAPAPRVAAPVAAVTSATDPFPHLPAPFRQVLAQPQNAEALLRISGSMGTHARELLSTLMKLAQVLRGQTAAHPHLAAFTHVASALSKDAERLAELTGTAGDLTPESLDVGAALESAAVLLQGALPPSIHVAVEVDPATPPAFCNPLALQQALLALADHARDGMPVGGHLLLTALPGQTEGMVEIQVRDTGAASALVDDEDSWHRRSSGERGRRGMDLALPLIRDLMDRVGGQVTVASSVSTGTCVVLSLPGRAANASVSSGSRARVLVVDDDAGLRRVTARMLEETGMIVLTAADGAEALQHLSGDTHFGALLLDLHMPRADGQDVLRFVQVMPNPPAVVVFTADDVNVVKDEVLALGAYAVMPKPFLGRELVATLKAAMRTRQV